jgi:integrase
MALRTTSRLTAAQVKQLSKIPGRHADGGGLYLQVSPAGVASWTYRYMVDGRERNMGLGPLRLVTLKQAREAAYACSRMRVLTPEGNRGNPLEARRARVLAGKLATAKAMTFRSCAVAYVAAHRAGWRSAKHAAQWPASLEQHVFPTFGDLPVQVVDTALVMKALEPMWTILPETAGRVRARIESVLDWATTRGYRRGENPARWRGHLENLLPKKSKVARVEHHPALPYTELPAFMEELRQVQGFAARALEFAILTASRTSEVIGARWAEFDLQARLWIVPGERMKAGREHRVPLAEAALAILEEMAAIRSGAFVFPGARGDRPMSSMALALVLRRIKRSEITVHGFRSTFSDWVAEVTSTPAEVRELAMAHAVGNKTEEAYRRGDLVAKRAELAEMWSQYCSGGGGGNIVPLRAAQ